MKSKRGKPKYVECVGGPCCGGLLGIFPDETEAELHDGKYVRREPSTEEERRDPLWMIVAEKLDWYEKPKSHV